MSHSPQFLSPETPKPVVKDAAYWEFHSRRHEARAQAHYKALKDVRQSLKDALRLVGESLAGDPAQEVKRPGARVW